MAADTSGSTTSTIPPRQSNAPLDPSERRVRRTLWAFALVMIAGAIAAVALILGQFEGGERPPFLADLPAATSDVSERHAGDVLWVAGSGTNLPLTRALADGFAKVQQDERVVVHESIGSTGGIRAAHDRAVDLGLISRPLSRPEAELGLTVIPYARVPVVLAAYPTVPVTNVTHADLLALYSGATTRWSDGRKVIVLQREQGDSGHIAVNGVLPAFADVNDEAYRAGRWRVLYNDRAMQEALLSTVGAIGLFDLGSIVLEKLPLKRLRIEGVEPSLENVASGRYPFYKSLAFVSMGPPSGPAAEFIAFVRSPAGRAIVEQSGYLPPIEEVP